MRLSLRYRAIKGKKNGVWSDEYEAVMYALHDQSPGSDDSHSLLTWSNVKVMVRSKSSTGKLKLKDGRSLNLHLAPELGMALLRTVLSISDFNWRHARDFTILQVAPIQCMGSRGTHIPLLF